MNVIHKWKYCVVGNIVETRIDENGILRYGTAAFRGNTRVYLCGKHHDFRGKEIVVLGLTRKGIYDSFLVPVELIKDGYIWIFKKGYPSAELIRETC